MNCKTNITRHFKLASSKNNNIKLKQQPQNIKTQHHKYYNNKSKQQQHKTKNNYLILDSGKLFHGGLGGGRGDARVDDAGQEGHG